MATTTKGVPYPEGSDPPNGPGQIQALAEWVDAALTGTDQQQLTADPTQTNRLRWRHPRARTAGSVPAGERGDLWCPTSGALEDVLHMHDGSGWVRVPPDLSSIIDAIAAVADDVEDLDERLPRGMVARANMNDLQTGVTSETDVTGLSTTFTGVAGRAYVVRVQAGLRASGPLTAAGYVTRGNNQRLGTWALWTAPPNPPAISFSSHLALGESPRMNFTGTSTVKARIERLSSSGDLTVVGNLDGGASISVYDVGLMP